MPVSPIRIRFPQFEAVECNPSNDWELDDGRVIGLLTLGQLRNMKQHAPDAELISIFGEVCNARDCDEDIRYGYVAYGQLKGAMQ